MTGSKITTMTSDEMQAAIERGESRTDWERVRQAMAADPEAAEDNRKIGELIEKLIAKRGRPVQGERKEAISLRLPVSVLARWKATGPGWQTRMAERLSKE